MSQIRTEFGFERTACACSECAINCRFIPGYLIPADLDRIAGHLGSENLIEFALDKRLKLGVHYCSLENKHTGQVYQQNSGQSIPKTMFFSQKDYFLKTARVFGDAIPLIQQALDKSGYFDYYINEKKAYLEFHVDRIKSLNRLDVEIGISSNVIEKRGDDFVLRELKVDVTTPQTFRLSKDI